MPHRHQLIVTADYDTVVAALASGPVQLEPVLPGKGLVRFADGSGFLHAIEDESLLNLMDEDDGLIVRQLTTHLRGLGFVVEHRDLGPD